MAAPLRTRIWVQAQTTLLFPLKTNILHSERKLYLRHLLSKSQIGHTKRCFGQPAAQTHPHLVKQGEVTPGITKHEYKRRRSKLIQSAVNKIPSTSEHIMIFPSAAKTYMSYDIPYTFRQNTEFLYLSGFQEPDSVLVMLATEKGSREVLFVPKRDPSKELWDGPRSGDSGSRVLTGVAEAFNLDQLESFLYQYCKDYTQYVIWYDQATPAHAGIHNKCLAEFLKQGGQKCIESPLSLIQQQRLIKSEAEIDLMRTSVAIASQAFIDVMKFSHPGVNESHLYAKMDYECRIHGAELLAYPPVVAGGNRANIIHYINNNQLVMEDEMVLMDAGCEYHGYTSDLTRTWPVSGKFTGPQRALYLALLQVQEVCITLCTPRCSLTDIYLEMINMLAYHLQHLGLIPSDITDREALLKAVREFCPHHVSHYLGMDVHDTGLVSRHIKLQPGMIITIEPGIYIPQDRTDVPEKFRGIGIRIEDNVLVTATQPEVLSASCPKHPDDIEQLMASS